MQGCDDEGHVHIFVENKFWAGLTANQPVSYLRRLAECTPPTILLVVGPEARQETLWRDLSQGLAKDKYTNGRVIFVYSCWIRGRQSLRFAADRHSTTVGFIGCPPLPKGSDATYRIRFI